MERPPWVSVSTCSEVPTQIKDRQDVLYPCERRCRFSKSQTASQGCTATACSQCQRSHHVSTPSRSSQCVKADQTTSPPADPLQLLGDVPQLWISPAGQMPSSADARNLIVSGSRILQNAGKDVFVEPMRGIPCFFSAREAVSVSPSDVVIGCSVEHNVSCWIRRRWSRMFSALAL